MIRVALLSLFLVAACGKNKDKKESTGSGSGSAVAQPASDPLADPLERLRRDTGVSWLATQHADGTFVLRPETPEPPRTGARAESAKTFLATYGDAVGLAQITLVPAAISDPAIVAFGQDAHGYPVIGANIVVRFESDGGIASVTGRRFADIAPPGADPAIDAAAAIAAFEARAGKAFDGFDASWLEAPAKTELAWWVPGIAQPQLAHVVTAKLTKAHGGFQLGAVVGADGVLAYFDGRQEVQGSGVGAWGKKTFDLEPRGTAFAMRRAVGGIWPANCGTAPAKQPMIEVHEGDAEAVLQSPSADGPWDGAKPVADRVIVDAYVHAEMALRYFRDRFCRNSFDGVGGDVRIRISEGGLWMDTYMRLGPGEVDDKGVAWLAYSSTLEVVAHEITHGIVNAAVKSAKVRWWDAWISSPDVAALGEGLGDVFGQLAEEHYNVTYSRARNLGILGENWAVEPGHYVRKFDDATAVFAERSGEEHVDSVQISSAFHRMVTGAEKLTLQQAESVWYGALAQMTPATTFASFAHDTLLAATRMNRAHASIPMKPIACAWVSVGVLLRGDAAAQWKIECPSPSADTIVGHWDWTIGNWGTMSFARAGDEMKNGKKVVIVRGVYTYRDGTVLLACDEALTSCTGQWWEASRSCSVRGEHGDAAFTLGSPTALDGKWLHLDETAWRQDWDLARSKDPVSEDDKKRLANDALFRCN